MENGLQEIKSIAIDKIAPSPANKRKIIEGSLKDLAASLKAQGMLQAIILRPNPIGDKSKFELVAGERRWRAARQIGWDNVPAVVCTLNDKEAHDITVTENLHREDLTVFEQAESIQVLLDDGRDPKEIADKLGKPVSWVVRRAKIKDLSPELRKEIQNQDAEDSAIRFWSASHLELIARLPVETQNAFLKDSLANSWQITPKTTLKELNDFLKKYQFLLSGALWKLEKEFPEIKTGSCNKCTKRSSCAPMLFADDIKAKSGDKCLDISCYKRKMESFLKAKIADLKKEHPKLVLLDKKDYYGQSFIPSKKSFSGGIVDSYRITESTKSNKKAVPALIIDGPGIGSIRYVIVGKAQDRGYGYNQPVDPVKAAKEKLKGKRIAAFCDLIEAQLKKENPAAFLKKFKLAGVLKLLFALNPSDWGQSFNYKKNASKTESQLIDLLAGNVLKELKDRRFGPEAGEGKIIAELFGYNYDAMWKKVCKAHPEEDPKPEKTEKKESKSAKKTKSSNKKSKEKVEAKKLKKGVCRVCGCTEATPCLVPPGDTCSWTDKTKTLCTACEKKDDLL